MNWRGRKASTRVRQGAISASRKSRSELAKAEELLRNIWRGFVSATLPDGRVLNEQQLRVLITHAASNDDGYAESHIGVHTGPEKLSTLDSGRANRREPPGSTDR